MRILKIMLPLLLLLIGSTAAHAQSEEEGVVYTLSTRCIPEDASPSFPWSSEESEGASVYFSPSIQHGFHFIQWEDESGNVVSTSSRFYYTMPAHDVTLIARFEYDPDSPKEPEISEIKKYATIHVDVNPAEGFSYFTVNRTTYREPTDIELEVGTTADFYAYGKTGFQVESWTENGEVVSTSYGLSFTVPEDGRSLTVNFVYDPKDPVEPGEPKFYRRLTLQANPYDAVNSFSGSGEHLNGTSFTVSASSNPYYIFENWTTEDGAVVSETQSFRYTMPNKHTTLTANFHYDFNPSNPDEPDSPSIDDQGIVGKPRITMKDETHVLILCSTPGATIYYTLDGSEPNTASDVYTDAVFVSGNIVVKAIAIKDGMTDSEVTTYRVTTYRAAMPEVAFESGKIKMTTTTTGASIHYTIDNSDPTSESPIYSAPLEPEEDMLIKAIASHEELTDSEIATYVFSREAHLMNAPVFSLTEDGKLVITAAVEDGTIRYTMDGSAPTATSIIYSGPITLTQNCTVKAYVTHINYYDSPVAEYVVDGFSVKTPTYEYKDLVLSLAIATEGAEIRYTLDGSIPSETSTLYSTPLKLMEDCTVVARGFKTNYEASDTISFNFVYADHQVATPTLTYDPEALTVTMACAIEDAEIRYTIDGEAPTAETGIKYDGPIAVVGNHTYTAKAFRSDLFPSDAATVTVDDQKVPTPTASYNAKQLTLACVDADAAIHYTTDGSAPTAESAVYSAPLQMSADCTVKFIAVREFFLNSDEAIYEFKVADHQVATPVLTYNKEAKTVTMACAIEDAEIRYTIDGEAPTAETGIKYDGAIAVVGNHTYTAKAFRSDLFPSEAASVTVNDQKVPTPTASFANRVLTISCPDANAQIRYTLDGTDPTSASTLYTAPVALSEDCTVKIIAQREYFIDSDVASFDFKVADHQVALPGFGYDAETSMLTITCATENAEIRYTSDGSDPTATHGIKYDAPIKVVGNATYKARAFRSDLLDSKVASLVISDQAVATPTASFANKLLTLSCEDADATIRYTLDGTNPTSESALYNAPLALTQDCTVKFIAQRENFNDSEVVAFQFKVADYQVAKPVFVYNTEAGSVTITCATENAEIRYALDGSIPTLTTGTKYEGAIAVTGNFSINARAFRSDLFDSETASLVVNDNQVPTPTARFANKHLTLACADSQAVIYYTTDGTDPTTSSAVYSAPLALTRNCTVKFFATRENYNASQIGSFQFAVENYMVATPVLTYNPIDSSLSISCATENAEIRYTADGSEPTATNGTIYTAPVTFYGNVTFNARAFRSDLFDSEVASLVISGQKVATPTARFAKKQLTLECSDANAQIRYTLDGSDPTSQSTLYTGPVALTSDCTVRFFASRENFNDSDVATFDFKVADYQVAAPVVNHSIETLKATMTCATAGASIRYTTDGTVPTATTGLLYSEPVDFDGNVTFTARAFHSDYFDSEPTVYVVSDMKLPVPTAFYGRHAVTIACEEESASIRYTTDGSAPTANSSLYSEPIPVSADCTVRFIATKTGYLDSEEGRYEFVLADHRESAPTFKSDFAGRKLIVDQSEGLPVSVTTKGLIFSSSEETMESPATVNVDQSMASVSAVALAQDPDRYDSETVSYEVVFHRPPVFDDNYDGHTLAVNVAENEPATDKATIRLYVDGKPDAVGTSAGVMTEISDFCIVQAYVESDFAFISEMTEKRIDFFNTGRIAGARNGHRLSEAIGTWGDKEDSYEYLRVKGELNKADLQTIGSLPNLTYLHIDSNLPEDDYNGILSSTRIETLCSSIFPTGMIAGMPRLATLIWGSASSKMPEGIVAEAGNPNILVWVSDEAGAPADAVNLVRFPASVFDLIADPKSHNVNGEAKSVKLKYGYPFNVYKPISVSEIELTKSFSLPTYIEECAGWESIVLPFDAESVRHEKAGEIISFAAWDETYGMNGPKPYWLYSPTDSGWDLAEGIEAGVPYIISMPNNEKYVEEFNLPGTVTFSARNVDLDTESMVIKPIVRVDGTFVEGTFMPVDGMANHALNVKGEGGGYNGSRFEPGAEIYPFGAYISGGDLRRAIPIFGNGTGVEQLPTISSSGIVVETPAPGTIRISSGIACQTAIVTPDGAAVRTISLHAGETLTVDGLTRGLYIVAGVKVMVK